MDTVRRFKKYWDSCQSDTRSRHLLTSQNEEIIDKVRVLFRNDKHVIVPNLSGECGISVGYCDAIFTKDLNIRDLHKRRDDKLCCNVTYTMLAFYDWEGNVLHEYAPPGQRVNKKSYGNVLKFWKGFGRKRLTYGCLSGQ